MSGEQKGREDAGGGYTIAVDDDGRVTLHLDRGDALHIGRIEDYPALRRKLGEEGVLDAVRGAVGDDVNVRRAAPGETDNSADVGDGADTRTFDLRRLGTFITGFKFWKRNQEVITRGETLVVSAPAGAVDLELGDGDDVKSVPVADGKARLDAETSADMGPGLWKTTWRVEVDGEVRRPSGPKVMVVAAAADRSESLGESLGEWFDKWEPRLQKLGNFFGRVWRGAVDLAERADDVADRRDRRAERREERAKERRNEKRKKRDEKRAKRKAKRNDAAGDVQ